MLADPVRVRHAIGVVAQKHGLDPEATGRENLTLQGEFYAHHRAPTCAGASPMRSSASASSTPPTGRRRRTRAACSAVSTWPWASSTGPEVLFLDEPTTGLDPEARADIWHEIERLARDERMTILLTTHYLEEADRLASQLAIVDRGRIVAEGSPDELKSQLEGDRIAGRARRRPATARRAERSRASTASATRRSRAAPCMPAPATARRRSPRCWPPSTPTA